MFFDADGKTTDYYDDAQQWIKEATNHKEDEDLFKEKFPMCNIEYKPEEGSRVWCSTKRYKTNAYSAGKLDGLLDVILLCLAVVSKGTG